MTARDAGAASAIIAIVVVRSSDFLVATDFLCLIGLSCTIRLDEKAYQLIQ